MKLIINCLLVLILLIGSPCVNIHAQENTRVTDSYFLHTVEKGQSLYSIASMYHVSSADIIRMNPGCEDKIYAGQALKIPQNKESNKNSQIFHTIQPQETLYQLTVRYNISAKTICEANPGLSAGNFKIGQVIIIPSAEETIKVQTPAAIPVQESQALDGKSKCRDMHRVQKKETIFSVSRQYGITEDELIAANPELKRGMKKGSFLCIPYPSSKNKENKVQTTTPAPALSDGDLFSQNKAKGKKLSTIKAAVILPFMSDGSNKSEGSRMVEYYEGFLMALDSLKKQGVSVSVYTYDSGNEKMSVIPILNKKEMKDMDIIFGPLYSEHIKPITDFAKKNKIHLVIPFTSKDNAVFSNPAVYQINTPQSYLYSEVYEHFVRKFPNSNVVILHAKDGDKEKSEFIKGLKQELKAHNIPFKTINADADNATLKQSIDLNKENIFIPTSGSNVTLIRTLPQLKLLVRENPEVKIHLFGYPEWQTYTKDHLESFYELDTYFYSSFYTNNLFPQAVDFTSAYRKWYGKDMANTYPKYGMLGFDTAYFFLKGLSRYGSNFENHIKEVNVTPIQTGFKFDRVNNWGGFINKKVFFVHFTKDFELVKLDFE